jgi:hypothetical protein
VGPRSVSLTAALIILCAYTVAFLVRLGSGPPQRQSAR